MVQKKPANLFIEKTSWPLKLPDINPVENLWSIMDEVVYKYPTPKTMKDLIMKTAQTSLEEYPALHALSLIPLHAATAIECDKKQRGA